MLGHSHALSGLAAGAATLPWAPVHGIVGQAAWVGAVGGFAMLPDLDQRGTTVSRMWGPVTDVPSGVVGSLARGHRWGTHDALLAPAAFGLLAALASTTFWSSLLMLAVSIGLALHALNFVIPGRVECTIVGNLAISWVGAWFLLSYGPPPMWLAPAVAVGVLAHIAGDALTTEGVPVPLAWIFSRQRMALAALHTGTTIERVLLAPLFLLATLAFLYVNTGAQAGLDPLVARIAHPG